MSVSGITEALGPCPLCGSEDPPERLMTGCGLPCDDAARWHEAARSEHESEEVA